MKKCKQGYYYCYTDKKCKRIPLGYHIGTRGYLAKDNEDGGEEGDGGDSSLVHQPSLLVLEQFYVDMRLCICWFDARHCENASQ